MLKQNNLYILVFLLPFFSFHCMANITPLRNPPKNSEITTNTLYSKALHNLDILKQKYIVENLDNTKGLSNSSVNTIFKDSENLIWIGTWDGLNRYDGNSFKIFRPELNNENSISNQVVLKIDEDSSGEIWILTMNGINKYNKKTDSFKHYYFSKQNKPTSSELEFNFALNKSKNIFCAVKDWGIGYLNGHDFKPMQTNLPKGAVKRMKFNTRNELIVLFENNNLYSLKIEQNKILEVQSIEKSVNTFEFINDEDICIISNNGNIHLYSLKEKTRKKFAGNKVQNIIGCTSLGVILSSKQEYFVIDKWGDIKSYPLKSYIQKQKITTIIESENNILWTGTDGDGLIKMYPTNNSFNLIDSTAIPEFRESIVRAFSEDESGNLWVGTKGQGLYRLSSAYYKEGRNLKYQNFNENNSSINNSVYSLFQGKDKLLFIGTDGEGLNVWDLSNNKLFSWNDILNTNLYQSFRSTYSIYQDEKGYIWAGTNGYGLIRCQIKRNKKQLELTDFKTFTSGNDKENKLSSNIIYAIVPKSSDELWIGTRLGGLNLFNKKNKDFKIFKNDKNNPNSISNDDILSLNISSDNKLWIGTSFGLNSLEAINNQGEATFKRYTTKDGLPNNTVHGIVIDTSSNLWLSTNLGLSNFIAKDSVFINYTKDEGLQNNEFADGAFYRNKKYIFMGGIKGFNYFDPSKIKASTIIPDLFIDKISSQNAEKPYYQNLVISSSSNHPPKIELNHNENFFNVKLSTLSYINNEKCQYSYWLENFDPDWNFIKNRKNISFTNVPPGSYSLWVKWSNSDGIWSKPTLAIKIKIKPIFWQSHIAFILYFLLFISLLWLILSYYNGRQRLKQNIIFRQQEAETHQNRLNFFTNIAHELQTPLTLIIGPTHKLSESPSINEQNRKFIEMIQRNSSRLLLLTQQLLEFRKAEYDHLDVEVKQFDLLSLIEQIAELFDELALQKNINYILETPKELSGWFDKDKVEKIIFNLLSNAFKYTPANGKIKLTFSIKNQEELCIVVANTGKGIPKDKINSLFNRFFLSDNVESTDSGIFRTGIGLAYTKKLVTVLNGKISVSSKVNKKTVFKVILPCNKEAFDKITFNKEQKQVLISHHLQNIVPSSFNAKESQPTEKINSLNSITNDKKVILVVEDERDVQVLLQELLAEKYQIITASNGLDALRIVNNSLPDLIISDVMMPDMNGIELCNKIKADNKTYDIPFIMLTAKSSLIHRIEGLEIGANAYIAKPFHPDHLLVRIHKLLEEKELRFKNLHKTNFPEDIFKLPDADNEKEFMRKVIDIIHNNINNEELKSSFLEKELGVSSSQLYRKTKQALNFSPGDLIRTIRLKYAAELLQKSNCTVSEACYQSGFNNRSYFYREFKKIYHLTPKNYQLKFKQQISNLKTCHLQKSQSFCNSSS